MVKRLFFAVRDRLGRAFVSLENIEAAIGRRSLSHLPPVRTGDVLVTTAGLRAAA